MPVPRRNCTALHAPGVPRSPAPTRNPGDVAVGFHRLEKRKRRWKPVLLRCCSRQENFRRAGEGAGSLWFAEKMKRAELAAVVFCVCTLYVIFDVFGEYRIYYETA